MKSRLPVGVVANKEDMLHGKTRVDDLAVHQRVIAVAVRSTCNRFLRILFRTLWSFFLQKEAFKYAISDVVLAYLTAALTLLKPIDNTDFMKHTGMKNAAKK